MSVIVTRVQAALEPLISERVVSDIRLAGLASYDGGLQPLLSIRVIGERPEAHSAEISRLLARARLHVQWTMTTAADARWPRAKHLVR